MRLHLAPDGRWFQLLVDWKRMEAQLIKRKQQQVREA